MTHQVHSPAPFGWYEAGLPLGERKQRGHFSTPLALVDQILDACGYRTSADLRHLRVLDPACGSGNFLARATQRLCLSVQAQGLKPRQLRTLVQHNIWGLDPDPVACCLAEMQVCAAIDATCISASRSSRQPHLHIHQTDSLVLPWQPCVDLLLANPPYLAAKNSDLSHYRQARQRGQADSYLLFLDLALQAVRPDGWFGLVLPDPVLARANAAPERTRLLSECTLQHIWHLANVFTAEVGAAVIIGQKTPPSPVHQVTWTSTRWQTKPPPQPTQPSHTIAQELLAHQPNAELRYLLSSEQGQISERLRHTLDQPSAYSSLLPLEDLVDIKRGEELGRENGALRPLAELTDGYRVLRGGIDLRPYTPPETAWGIAHEAIKKPIERYAGPKLLVVKSSKYLQAALDMRGHVVLQTLYVLQIRDQHKEVPLVSDPSLDHYYFLLALLNSRLLRDYVVHLHTAYKLVHPQIEQGVLARLPVAWGEPGARHAIAERARALEQACSSTRAVVEWGQHLTFLYEEQEQAIRVLYAAAVPEIFC